MPKPKKTFAQFVGADKIIAEHQARELAKSSNAKFGAGKVTLFEAAGVARHIPSLVDNRTGQTNSK